jgi:hypothetical protein
MKKLSPAELALADVIAGTYRKRSIIPKGTGRRKESRSHKQMSRDSRRGNRKK